LNSPDDLPVDGELALWWKIPMSIVNLSAALMTAALFMAASAVAQTIWHGGNADGKVVERRCVAHAMPSEVAIFSGGARGTAGFIASK
jgi:hypothetical protein